jgi:hypothetical protein
MLPIQKGSVVSNSKPNQAYLDQLRMRYAGASKKVRSVIVD